MRIQGPLVVDVSCWDHHISTKELIAGGVVSVILGLYRKSWPFGNSLNDNCKRILDQICASELTLQTYFYYYTRNDPVKDADWYADQMVGYPVKYAWADFEDISGVVDGHTRSEQYRKFALELHNRFPLSGVYTAKWYIDGFAPEMNTWLPHYNAWVSHYGHQPLAGTIMSWWELRQAWLPNYDIILAPGQLPANVQGHQFTDKPIVPGAYDQYNRRRPLDVSVFRPEFIATISGQPVPLPIPAPVNLWKVNAGVNPNVHQGSGSGPTIGNLFAGDVISVNDLVTELWYAHFLPTAAFKDGGWVYKPFITKI